MGNFKGKEIQIPDPKNSAYFLALKNNDFQSFLRKHNLLVYNPSLVEKGIQARQTQKIYPQSRDLADFLLLPNNQDRFIPVTEAIEAVLNVRYTFLDSLPPDIQEARLLEESFKHANENLESIIQFARKAGIPIYHHYFGVSVGCEEIRLSPTEVIFLEQLYKGETRSPRALYGVTAVNKSNETVTNYVGYYVSKLNKILGTYCSPLSIKGKYGVGYRLLGINSEQ